MEAGCRSSGCTRSSASTLRRKAGPDSAACLSFSLTLPDRYSSDAFQALSAGSRRSAGLGQRGQHHPRAPTARASVGRIDAPRHCTDVASASAGSVTAVGAVTRRSVRW